MPPAETVAVAAEGYTVATLARRWKIGKDKVRGFLTRGELVGINLAANLSSKPQWRVTGESVEQFERRRSSAPRRRRRSGKRWQQQQIFIRIECEVPSMTRRRAQRLQRLLCQQCTTALARTKRESHRPKDVGPGATNPRPKTKDSRR
jgi:hypothetical protein